MPESIVAAYGDSHVGKVRSDNQDALRILESADERGALYGIADGMGGYEHGGVASSLALETFFHTFYDGQPNKPARALRQGVQAANLAVHQAAQRLGSRMGTTLSVVNIAGNKLHIAHVGDSRVYLVRDHRAQCLTRDHTAVGELVRMRLLSPDKVRTHERRSVLQKALGIDLFLQPDIITHSLQDGDYLILCTDGVWAYIEDDEFARFVLDIKTPELISQKLIDVALERDSDDNVSAVVIQVVQLAPTPTPAPSSQRSLTRLLIGLLGGKA